MLATVAVSPFAGGAGLFRYQTAQSHPSSHQTTSTQPVRRNDGNDLYRIADSFKDQCYSSIDSPDPRSREISRLATDTIIQLCNELLRKPLLLLSQAASAGRIPGEKVPITFPPEAVADPDVRKYYLLIPGKQGKPDMRALYLPVEQFQDVMQKALKLVEIDPKSLMGLATTRDIQRRTCNVILSQFTPEAMAITRLYKNRKAPITPEVLGVRACLPVAFRTAIGNEAARRMFATGFDRNKTEVLVAPLLAETPDPDYQKMHETCKSVEELPFPTW